MKKTVLFLYLGVFLFATGIANAAFFNDTIDWNSEEIKERDGLELNGQGDPYQFNYSHDVTFIPPAAEITSASLTLSHYNNSGSDTGELWLLFDGSMTQLGQLVDGYRSFCQAFEDQIVKLPLFSQFHGRLNTISRITSSTSEPYPFHRFLPSVSP